MSNETYSVEKREENGKCLLCGANTNNFVFAGNDSGGTTTFICDKCGYDIINRLVQDADFRKTASEKNY